MTLGNNIADYEMAGRKSLKLKQTAVSLPPDMRARLAPPGSDLRLGEEIRRRLQASLDADSTAIDAKTSELLALISDIARNVTSFYGPWHSDSFAFEVFTSAANTALSLQRPSGEMIAKPGPDSLAELFFDERNGPEAVGRAIAAMAINSHRKTT